MGVWYTSREDVMSALDIKAAAYAARDVDSAIEGGARAADSLLNCAAFAPTIATRYFDFPGTHVAGVRLYLEQHQLISLSTLTAGGVTISASDYFLEPANDGPPYRRIDLSFAATRYWQASTTRQRAIAALGVWGHSNVEENPGTTAEVLDASETGIDGSGMPTVGVGAVIRVDSERMIVTDKSWLTTAQTGSLAAQQNAQTLAVADGTAFASGEVLLLDAERVKVVDIAGNNLTVRRAVDGTTLAVHTTATIYALRTFTVTRGALGTTAATHLTSAPVYRWLPPEPLGELNRAYAINTLLQRQSGYAGFAGKGDNSKREMPGLTLADIEQAAKSALGRQMRTRAS